MKKLTILSLFAFSAMSANAWINAGDYSNMQMNDRFQLNQTNDDLVWTFTNVEFIDGGNAQFNNDFDTTYSVSVDNCTGLALDSLRLERGNGDLLLDFKNSTVDLTKNEWCFYVSGSKTGNAGINTLKLSGATTLTARHICMASDAGFSSGKGIIDISGGGNSFTVSGDSYMNKNAAEDRDIDLIFNISGVEGNKSTASFTKMQMIANGTSENTTSFNLKGDSTVTFSNAIDAQAYAKDANIDITISGNNNTLRIEKDFMLGQAASVASNFNFEMSGSNNELYVGGGTYNALVVGGNATAGNFKFVIGGSNNKATFGKQSWIGTDKSNSTSSVEFVVDGSGHDITFVDKFAVRVKGETDSAVLKMVADENGLSTIKAGTVADLSADFTIDLSDFIGDDTGTYEIALISAANDWNNIASRFIGSSESGTSKADVIMGENGLDWALAYADKALVLIYNYAPIPEPSTYAMILGALALGFVAYRRRK